MTEMSKEYAAALFALACEEQAEQTVASALEQIFSAWQENPAYGELLASPAIPQSERRQMIAQAFAFAPQHVISFMQLLCERGRIRILPACVEEYRRLLQQWESRAIAKVTSAVALTEEEKAALAQKLQRFGSHTVTLECTVDPSLIGGIIVEMDGRLIDGSLRHRLQQVKEVITK